LLFCAASCASSRLVLDFLALFVYFIDRWQPCPPNWLPRGHNSFFNCVLTTPFIQTPFKRRSRAALLCCRTCEFCATTRSRMRLLVNYFAAFLYFTISIAFNCLFLCETTSRSREPRIENTIIVSHALRVSVSYMPRTIS
jgi:hypothetical protein